MKKMIAMLMALTMMFSFAACGGAATQPTTQPTTAPTEAVKNVEGTMEELLNKIIEIQPVEFMGGTMPIDLTDTSEDGLWFLSSNTGLPNADDITDAAFFGPMMGSIAFSLVMVRTAEGTDAKTVAEAMKAGIDPRKWICVEANDLKVATYGDVAMLIMVDSNNGLSAQSYVDAFAQVAGAELDFVA